MTTPARGRDARNATTLSRRGFLVGASLVAVGPALAARAQATPPAGGPTVITGTKRTVDATPSGEQRLRLAGPVVDPVTIDPAGINDITTAFLARQVFAGLVRFDEDLNPIPDLAQRIEISEDGLTYRFELWPDATYADGTPIAADDVVKAISRALNPQDGTPVSDRSGPTFLSDIAGADQLVSGEAVTLSGAKVIDDRTLELTLTAPQATFLMKLAAPQAAVADPRDVAKGGDWWKSPNASGPFKVGAWKPGEQLLLAANDRYVLGRPTLDNVDLRLGPGASNPWNLFQAGQVDATDVPINALDGVLDPSSPLASSLVKVPYFSTEYIAFRTDVEPLDDPHVRRAILLAYPRDKVAEVTLAGRAEPGDSFIPPGMLGRDWPSVLPDHDVEAAKQEIAKSRYGSADKVPTIEIYAANPTFPQSLRDVLKQDLGLTVDVIDVEWQTFMKGLGQQSFPAYDLSWIADYPDPENFLGFLFGTGSASNYSGYSNPAFDALLDQAARTLATDARADLYAKAQDVLLGDNVVLPLYHDVRYSLVKPTVHGYHITPIGVLELDGVWIQQ